MKYGYYADREIPVSVAINKPPLNEYKLNSKGYRCPEWEPMPDGKKNVVVLGCSHTFGQGNADNEHWVHFLSKHNTNRLRYWNLGQPGASSDKVVRILYGCEKLIDPRNYNGGMFIGVNGIVIKSHGNADSHAFANAIEFGVKCIDFDLLNEIKKNVSR